MGAIVADVWDNADKLVGQHLQLALSELETRVEGLKTDLTIITVGGLVMYAGVLAAVATAILALAMVLPAWAASLIVSFVALSAGYLMLQRKKHLSPDPAFSPTVQSIKRTGQTLKEAVK